LYHKRNILPELKGLIDAISISLNADNAALYEKLHRPIHGKKAFKAMLEFARESKEYISDVTLTCIKFPRSNIEKSRKIAKKLEVDFRVRPYLDEYESS